MKKNDFVRIIMNNLKNFQKNLDFREYKMISCLNRLFEEIDINGNGILEWEEFTNYIIDKANILNKES